MYDPQIEFAAPLIPRDLTFELDERTLADGSVLRGVDAGEVGRDRRRLGRKGASSRSPSA